MITIRCFPHDDTDLTDRVHSLLAGLGETLEPDDLETHLRQVYPSARVVRRDALAEYRSDEPVFYVFREGAPG